MQDTRPVAVLITRLLQQKDDSVCLGRVCGDWEECAVAKLPSKSLYTDVDCSGLEVTLHPTCWLVKIVECHVAA